MYVIVTDVGLLMNLSPDCYRYADWLFRRTHWIRKGNLPEKTSEKMELERRRRADRRCQ